MVFSLPLPCLPEQRACPAAGLQVQTRAQARSPRALLFKWEAFNFGAQRPFTSPSGSHIVDLGWGSHNRMSVCERDHQKPARMWRRIRVRLVTSCSCLLSTPGVTLGEGLPAWASHCTYRGGRGGLGEPVTCWPPDGGHGSSHICGPLAVPLGPMFAISESSLALSPGARFPTGPHPLLALCQVLGIGDR